MDQDQNTPGYEKLLQLWPEYTSTVALDELRKREYARLDRLGEVYLDYTGAGLYSERQIQAHHALLEGHLFGNPHSHNPSSQRMTDLVERTRASILSYFNASPDEYVAIFTQNASGALKLVGESYPFSPEASYLLTFDNHNSVNGIREFARAHGAGIHYVPMQLPEMTLDEGQMEASLSPARAGNHLFAYPAQSNFSGVQHSLAWIERAQALGWDVLLDAAAYVPTNRLDLSVHKPEFVTLSFYKMFGYPTGIGCLLARRSVLGKLRRPWFAGGTITVASVQGDRYFMAEGAAAFEDGTVDFLNIPGIEIGLDHMQRADVDLIHTRCACLTGWMIEELGSLHHANGSPAVRIYGPGGRGMRGGTITMNFYDPAGRVVDHHRVEEEAARHRISLRSGCFCNPGGGELALSISKTEIIGCFNQPWVQETSRFTPDDFRLCVDGKGTGAVRVSFGIASNFDDAARFAAFARRFIE
ncbi:MAG: aminotransferase class V-fold PLP-dependent enzyme [Acidobacteria bacterium]|nr:aminotransferase class V-fold PLP-dependent enzyme [Acidobacteriota bacterium]